MRPVIYLILCITLVSIEYSCAKRGAPSGGEKDSIPPIMIRSNPKQNSVFFDESIITLTFDEYIKLNDVNKQLIISPPLEKKNYEIKPKTSASKKIEIKLLKSLEKNTTYTFNFGKSIEDFNESNPLPFFSYAISTGANIDSLTFKGVVKDALEKEPDSSISIQLYPIDSSYTDSTIFLKKPLYVSTTDSVNFKFENLRAGKYELIALKDNGSNYLFDQNIDKIGFLKTIIEIPNDSFAAPILFKEITDFAWGTPKSINDHHVKFPYYGDLINTEITLLSETTNDFKFLITRDRTRDTLNFWFSRNQELDSLIFNLKALDSSKTVIVKPRININDSLIIQNIQKTFLNITDSIKIESNIPIVAFNLDSIQVIDIDSLSVPFKVNIDKNYDRAYINIKPLPNDQYHVILSPSAFKDFWGRTNKKFMFSIKTKAIEDYGIIIIQVQGNISCPYFIELLNYKGELVKKVSGNNLLPSYEFSYLDPGKYSIRLIKDLNDNNKWDTGNYLLKLQPEEVIYLDKEIDLRANWEITESLFVE